MKVSISPPAYNDLSEAYNFYESLQTGLGEYFQDSLFSAKIKAYDPKVLTEARNFSRGFYVIDKIETYYLGILGIMGTVGRSWIKLRSCRGLLVN